MRLIDADALAKELMHEGLGYQYNRVVNAPTIDTVPVIRCKDCKYCSPNKTYGCTLERFSPLNKSARMYSYDFCSLAERKEE